MKQQQKGQRKRAKKGDVQGDFKCTYQGCGKEYLSYPALYTHIKSKHGDQFLKGMERPKTQGSRGRPRRDELTTPQVNEQPPLYLRIQIEAKQSVDDFLLELVESKYKQLLQSEAEMISNDEIRKTIDQVMQFIQHNSNGNIQDSFIDTLNQVLNTKEMNYVVQDNIIKISCDEAISLFLKELSYTLNLSFLANIAYFLLSFRNFAFQLHQVQPSTQPTKFGEYLNDFMEKRSEYFNVETLQQFYEELKESEQVFLMDKAEDLQRKIGLHFCNWLFSSRYTSQQLKLQ